MVHLMKEKSINKSWSIPPTAPLGFTLIELIMIIVILAVLAIMVMPRFADKDIFETHGFREEIMSLLHYAQKTAVAQRRTVCVNLNPRVTLAIASAPPPSTTCNLPLVVPATPNTQRVLTANQASFNFLASGGTDQAANVLITIVGGSNGITIDAVTGNVY
ncbi:MSHA pilin protein MshC [Gammaproteobacteria bacterium]